METPAQYRQTLRNAGDHMVALSRVLRPFYRDIRYATTQNFTGQVLYRKPELYLRATAAEALRQVQDSLLSLGLNLLIFDAYRPYDVTEKMWAIIPDDRYAASPATGSGHNRGAAIDLTLCEAATGKPLPMPTGYDNFSDSAHYAFVNLPPEVLRFRTLLRSLMEHFGFVALSTEWWHFSLPNARQYPLMNLSFGEMKKLQRN